MESTTSAGPRRDLRPAARLTVLALMLWAVVDVFRTIMAIGHYEHRITVFTHGNADVPPAWMVYELVHHLLPAGTADTVTGWSWIAASLVAAGAVLGWLRRAPRAALTSSWWATVLVMLLFQGLGLVYLAVTSPGAAFAKTALDTRWVAYPLWTAATVLTVLAATRTVRMVRQVTQAR